MPSPAIQIYKARHARSCSQVSSPVDSNSLKDRPLSPWPDIMGRKRAAYSYNIDLDRRISQTIYNNNKGGGYSPYYSGLTNSSLDINRLKALDSSHGMETSKPRSKSATRLNEWSFWLRSLVKEKHTNESSHHIFDVNPPSTTTATSITTLAKELGKDGEVEVEANNRRKPLRERISSSSSSSSMQRPNLSSYRKQPLVTLKSPPRAPMVVEPQQLPISATEIIPDQCAIDRGKQTSLSKSYADSNDKNRNEGVLQTSKPSLKNMKASLGRDFLWADRYRPETLDKFICNKDKALELLQEMAKEEHHCGHFIFEGPPGVGKRTMITALLREAFGGEQVQATEKPITFELKGEAIGSIEVMAKVSSQHVEVNIEKVKGYEKHVIIDLIKENYNRPPNVPLKCNREDRRAIVLYEADQISADVLPYIRWLLEKYRGRNSWFFCCTKASKLQSLASLCKVVRLNAPSNENIVEVMKLIAEKEGIELPLNLAVRIANNSKNNLRQAIRSFEATSSSSHQLKEDQEIKTGWEDDIEDIAISIIEEHSPKQLYIIRRKLQNILEHNVSLEFFFMTLMKELMKHLPEQLQTQMEKMHKDYIDRLEEMNIRQKDPVRRNAQHFLRIEAFIAKFMSWYKATAVNRKPD